MRAAQRAWLQRSRRRTNIDYALVQQTKVNGLAGIEAEALLTRFPLVETGNLDYQARDMVALVGRIVVDGAPVDVYVTHLYMSRGDDALRLYQVQQLLAWIDSRNDVRRASCAATSTRHWTRLRPPSWRRASGARRARRPHSRRWPKATARFRIPTGRGWTAASTTSGSPRREDHRERVCFDKASPDDPSLWPSDHAGVWADLEIPGASRQ